MGTVRIVVIFSVAVIDTVLLTSIVSSQLVLADISSFGLDVTIGDRLSATVRDLLNLAPALLFLIAPGFLVAFLVARYAERRFGGRRTLWYMAAGFASVPAVIYLIKLLMGMTLLASARTPAGMILVSCCGMLGGWIYALLSARFGKSHA